MDWRAKTSNNVLTCTVIAGLLLLLTNFALCESASPATKTDVLRFDAVIELNAPLCRTHVVLFARYWVSPDFYRAALVWGEPHAGSLNFPIFPRSLNVASDVAAFRIKHQFQHIYDGVFPRPLGRRGPFLHKFNSYYFSDIRFAEEDALAMRINAVDIGPLGKTGRADADRVFDINLPVASDGSWLQRAKLSGHTINGVLDNLSLFDDEGKLIKSIEYEYTKQKDGCQLRRQSVLLPERPIMVGFKGEGPTIKIGGEKHQFSQLETTHHQGGRKCIVDYQPMEIAGREVSLPVRITVYSGDMKRRLRSAKLLNFTQARLTGVQINESAERFSFLNDEEIKCRDMFMKYWLKDPGEVDPSDRRILQQLHTDFSGKSIAGLTIGEQLRHMNVLLQLDCMLGREEGLRSDFEQYLTLLAENDLGRMILVGGQHAIELTVRWGQINVADRLLDTWLAASISQNDTESLLEFATDGVKKKSFWTIVKLTDKILGEERLSDSQRSVAKSLRSVALAQLYEMVENPGNIKTEFGLAQAWWVSSNMSAESLRASAEND